VECDGLPNARMVLLKDIEDAPFVFYTNLSQRPKSARKLDRRAKPLCDALEIGAPDKFRGCAHHCKKKAHRAALIINHGSLKSRLGALGLWTNTSLLPAARLWVTRGGKVTARRDQTQIPPRFWGGYRITPVVR